MTVVDHKTFIKTYRMEDWARDIAQFENYKSVLSRMTGETVRAFVIRRMHEIKGKWPIYIKEEIPER